MKKLALLLGLFVAVSLFISSASAQSSTPLINNLGIFSTAAGIVIGAGLILFLLDGLLGKADLVKHPKNIVGLFVGALVIASVITVFFASTPVSGIDCSAFNLSFVPPTLDNGTEFDLEERNDYVVNASSGIIQFPPIVFFNGINYQMNVVSGNRSAWYSFTNAFLFNLWHSGIVKIDYNVTYNICHTETRMLEITNYM